MPHSFNVVSMLKQSAASKLMDDEQVNYTLGGKQESTLALGLLYLNCRTVEEL